MQPEKKEARTGSQPVPSLAETFDDQAPFSNPSTPPRQALNEELLDEILTCWRWARSLDHRLGLYQLQFERDVAGALDTDHWRLANEVASFKTVAQALGTV